MARSKSKAGRGKKSRPALLSPKFSIGIHKEIELGYPAVRVLGIDEVGRGCLAGPVVAGAVLLPDTVLGADGTIDYETHPWLKDVNDSKCVDPEAREELVPLIQAWAGAYGIGVASVEEIDKINIFHASHLAMLRAVENALAMASSPQLGKQLSKQRGGRDLHALVDGKFLPKGLPCRASAVIKGDLQCLSIAAASILAKVWRDRLMVELDARYPGYGFAAHKGYSTPVHKAALEKIGACIIHRRSFAPVAEAERFEEKTQDQFDLF